MSLESSKESSNASPSPESRGQRWLVLEDPTVVRAVAHPIRLEVMELIGRHGRLTTADAARELGISHGLASHHLRQLAKYGFVEQVAGKDNRERPWRLLFTSQRVEGVDADPELADAADVLERISAERVVARFIDWQRRRGEWSAAWNQQAGLSQTNVYLTFDELAELNGAIEELIVRYVNERPIDDLASRPAGSVPVNISTFVVPHSQPARQTR
ncbi:helix-turn-helix domain-containing protein [Catenulispora yoronensis]|uniref:Helix-turn-helix domain-containing protein n=1 Tax=Catenulispora yoronensis TaxID=450799 RepID=A0ABP5F4N0_9ACTN